MSSPIIQVEGLSKRYLLGHQASQGSYQSLRETLSRTVRSAMRTTRDMLSGRQLIQGDELEEFWALKDVSFEVNEGEVLGVIGRNGAGKSTLLKILSRITEPTYGKITLRGRIASLLEVGTGFHPELSGRENIFLNGAILGMSRAEIKAKFDEIVDFAEVERFLDTPVKRYSSGMYVRLAFAVAAHLEPEILIIDEVLAVGDVGFQRKCLGKMKSVAASGRTVLFVSHNLGALNTLTERAILLESGTIRMVGPTHVVVSSFLNQQNSSAQKDVATSSFRRSYRDEGYVNFTKITINDGLVGEVSIIRGASTRISLQLEVLKAITTAHVTIAILDSNLDTIAKLFSTDQQTEFNLAEGNHQIDCVLGSLPLRSGDYFASIAIGPMAGGLSWDVLENLPIFSVAADNKLVAINDQNRPGCLYLSDCSWHQQSESTT
ncbi:MAG: polysaccharide ABC transporter ATP-binding protein [Verrucomicrobia bacterium]|nr:polysaccharide ABC transporter ATP-binding protein [Verrucomicrobiota bacterium]